MLEAAPHESLHRHAEFPQPAVEEMLRARENFQFRPRFERVEPFNRFIDIHKLVLIALKDQPGAIRLGIKIDFKSRNRRCNASHISSRPTILTS